MRIKRASHVIALTTAAFLLAASILTVAFAQSFDGSSDTRSLPAIKTRADFDMLARVYHQGTPYALPHILFVIDRQDENKIYYINSKRYTFHVDFVNGTYLSLERGDDFFKNTYINPNRRFILGTLAYQTPVKRWTFEFWEGDLIPSDQIELAYGVINKTFFEPVAYKPNSLRQEEASATLTGMRRRSIGICSRRRRSTGLSTAISRPNSAMPCCTPCGSSRNGTLQRSEATFYREFTIGIWKPTSASRSARSIRDLRLPATSSRRAGGSAVRPSWIQRAALARFWSRPSK